MKPPQSRVGAIFLLSGTKAAAKTNANVRGSEAPLTGGADSTNDDWHRPNTCPVARPLEPLNRVHET